MVIQKLGTRMERGGYLWGTDPDLGWGWGPHQMEGEGGTSGAHGVVPDSMGIQTGDR